MFSGSLAEKVASQLLKLQVSIPTEPLPVFPAGSVLCPFLEDHKEDILCGPVWLASGLDLSGHAGMLSLTSPKLVKGIAHVCLHCQD